MAKLVVMVGLPGAGKSTHCESLKNEGYKVHSSDAIREEKLGNIGNQEHNGYVFSIMKQRTIDDLKKGYDVVYDATNLSRKSRRHLISQVRKYTDSVKALVILRHYEKLFEYNSARGFPEHKLKQYIISFNLPTYTEGFTEIEYKLNDFDVDYPYELIREHVKFMSTVVVDNYIDMNTHPYFIDINGYDQNNPYHSKTLDQHIYTVAKTSKNFRDKEVTLAALFHDVGKPMAAVGNKYGGTSYYGHENISAYATAMLFERCKQVSEYFDLEIDEYKVLTLVSYHMRMTQIKTDKSKRKLIQEVGKELYPHLCELFVSDVSGK